jgi:hypothetical protein
MCGLPPAARQAKRLNIARVETVSVETGFPKENCGIESDVADREEVHGTSSLWAFTRM